MNGEYWPPVIPPSLDIIHEDSPTFPNPPEGSRIISAWAYPAFTTIGGAEAVHTLQMDFYSPFAIHPTAVQGALEMVRWLFETNDLELATYILWEKEEFGVTIPEEFCLFDWCWIPPFAGETVSLCYFYRLWIMSVERPGLAAMALPSNARPNVHAALGATAIIAIAIAIIMVLTTVVGIVAVWSGSLPFSDIQDMTHDFITAPGENIRLATMWPMFMLGFALVAASVALPIITTRVTVPVGRRGEVAVEAGERRAPARKRKKKKRS